MPPDQLNEQELQFKKRARRRLVGAIALVLLMVTILPMVLDDRSHKAPQQEIAITIPSQTGEFTSKVVPVVPDAPPTEATQAEIEPAPQQEAPVDPPVASPKSEKAPASRPVELPPSVAPPSKPNSTIVIPTEQARKETKSETTPDAKNEPKPVEKKTAEKNALFVQIGVFSDPANVKQLQQKLTAQGFKPLTEKMTAASGEKIRLRLGPYGSREEAENALGKLKASGMAGIIVNNK